MKLLKAVAAAIVGLFVDDEFLALATLAVVGIAAIILKATTLGTIVAAVTLLGGCLAILVVGIWRTARRRGRP